MKTGSGRPTRRHSYRTQAIDVEGTKPRHRVAVGSFTVLLKRPCCWSQCHWDGQNRTTLHVKLKRKKDRSTLTSRSLTTPHKTGQSDISAKETSERKGLSRSPETPPKSTSTPMRHGSALLPPSSPCEDRRLARSLYGFEQYNVCPEESLLTS